MQLFVYFSVFTPYVAAFLLNEPGYNAPPAPTENYGDDPIVIVDLVGKKNVKIFFSKFYGKVGVESHILVTFPSHLKKLRSLT